LERYRVVRRHAIVERIVVALKRSGADVLESADPRTAPFEFVIRTPTGERLELVCYAFTANKYGQQGRPADEHRFQIKYGSEFDRYHTIYLDQKGQTVTLASAIAMASMPAAGELANGFRGLLAADMGRRF